MWHVRFRRNVNVDRLRVRLALSMRPRGEVYVVQCCLLVERRRLAFRRRAEVQPQRLLVALPIRRFVVLGGLLDERTLLAHERPRAVRDGEVLACADRLDDLALVSRVQRAPKRAGDERGEDPERPLRRDLLRDLYVLSERYRRREK